MSGDGAAGRLQPFFLDAPGGRLFCLYFEPAVDAARREPVLFLPPFAEELNKSRRMIALQARALSRQGHGVLVVDLFGTGDSEGDFAAARWERWVDDLMRGASWLAERHGEALSIWGLRSGALFSAELQRALGKPILRLALWQPVISGQQLLTQFLRLRVAAALTGVGTGPGTRELRAELQAGTALEIAGYELAPALAAALDERVLAAEDLCKAQQLGWFEIISHAEQPLPIASSRLIEDCRTRQPRISTRAVQGQGFWATPEITVVPELLEVTSAFFAQAAA